MIEIYTNRPQDYYVGEIVEITRDRYARIMEIVKNSTRMRNNLSHIVKCKELINP